MIIDQYFITRNVQHQAEGRGSLELFKNLLQPHFLFNSLNNLYALSVHRAEQTPEAIAGLSQLLEKVVMYSRRERIPLSDEISLIEDYISLEKIWLGEYSFLLDFQVKGQTEGILVPPMTVYTLVENAFKHGIRKNGNQGWITIHLAVKKGKLLLKIRNSVSPDTTAGSQEVASHQGLGIAAVRKMLDDSYRKSYYLDARNMGNVYAVDLIIGQVAA